MLMRHGGAITLEEGCESMVNSEIGGTQPLHVLPRVLGQPGHNGSFSLQGRHAADTGEPLHCGHETWSLHEIKKVERRSMKAEVIFQRSGQQPAHEGRSRAG